MIAPDQAVRDQAIDPKGSFIVQAPAGSGKTALLTQRYLALLAHAVQIPEEIVAITFTRKAAAEMRERVLSALHLAQQQETTPSQQHEQTTWRLARAVLAKEAQWHLLQNPHRLQIMTFDSLCGKIVRQRPVTTGLGAVQGVCQDPSLLYQQAVTQLFDSLADETPWQQALEDLLQHCDNRFDVVMSLLCTMLAQREQWLEIVVSTPQHSAWQAALSQALDQLVQQSQDMAINGLPQALHEQLSQCYQVVYEQPFQATVEQMKTLSHWLLTTSGQWRKTVTQKQGFPAPSSAKTTEEKAQLKANKQQMLTLLAQCQDYPDWQQALWMLRLLPEQGYSAEQWALLESLLTLLPVLVAFLQLIFQKEGQVDFNEITLMALQALGQEDQPSDIALALDRRIQHWLIDEFQDTSQCQFQLCQQLLSGWEVGDGRSLFVVGDPMQSIYRFRQADVSLFIQAQQHGIGPVALTPLQLRANFRSSPEVITWINQTMQACFPQHHQAQVGAVAYALAEPMRPSTGKVPQCHYYTTNAEAQGVVATIQQVQAEEPDANIAILVRSRQHLQAILPSLQQAQIAYHAVELDRLADRLVVRDLLSLTEALLHWGDRLAWIALLRTPWCGIELSDLLRISQQSAERTVWAVLNDANCLSVLSQAAQQRLRWFVMVMTPHMQQRGHLPLRQWVEACWQDCLGPSCCQTAADRDDAMQFLDLLERIAGMQAYCDRQVLLQALSQLSAKSQATEAAVQVMTVHKAKGLEFDTVILPGLAKTTRAESQPLLLSQSLIDASGQHRWLLAPIHSRRDGHEPIYHYLHAIEKQKAHYELMRLLYVAVTRAKKRLFLTAELDCDEDATPRPPRRSLLGLVADSLPEPATMMSITAANPEIEIQQSNLWRIPTEALAEPKPIVMTATAESAAVEMATEASIIGTVFHQLLCQIGEVGLEAWLNRRAGRNSRSQDRLHHFFQRQLTQQGLTTARANVLSNTMQTHYQNLCQDPKAQWILTKADKTHIANEWALASKGGEVHIIDRCWREGNDFWIVDYKTAQPQEGQALEGFLRQERQQYRQQCETYAQLCQSLYPDIQTFHLGLYYPFVQAWDEWVYPN